MGGANKKIRRPIPQLSSKFTSEILVEVSSSLSITSTSSVFWIITALLPPALRPYSVTTLAHLSDAFAVPSDYSLPLLMARYGWPSMREGLSPFDSQSISQDGPHVTDDDSQPLQRAYSPSPLRYSLSQRGNPVRMSVKNTTGFRHLELTTISKDNTAAESLRTSASLAYLASKLTSCHDTSRNFEEEIMPSMARRKKNVTPEELAPNKCTHPGCNKVFKRPGDLTIHEKTHSRPWKCPISTCKFHEYGWPTEKELARHVNGKHSAMPAMYECEYKPCPYKSRRESNCKQHMEKAHGWRNKTKSNQETLPTRTENKMPTTSSIQAENNFQGRSYLCTYEGCERSISGNGFAESRNLRDHLQRTHNHAGLKGDPLINARRL
ncbi:hypothetical protein CIB48_g6929 [Xylaria polymorpha]|nr:hypothetical protein CIB48_g6929 [Xylaria polymorpha]